MNAIFSTGRVSLIQSYLKDRVTIRQTVFSFAHDKARITFNYQGAQLPTDQYNVSCRLVGQEGSAGLTDYIRHWCKRDCLCKREYVA